MKECIENGYNYTEISEKYKVGYQQIYTWVQKYKKDGEDALKDRRGRHKKDYKPQTEEERLRLENATLQQPPLPAQAVRPDSHAGSCQCHESGSLTGWLYKKFAVPLWKQRIKFLCYFFCLLDGVHLISCSVSALITFMIFSQEFILHSSIYYNVRPHNS